MFLNNSSIAFPILATAISHSIGQHLDTVLDVRLYNSAIKKRQTKVFSFLSLCRISLLIIWERVLKLFSINNAYCGFIIHYIYTSFIILQINSQFAQSLFSAKLCVVANAFQLQQFTWRE